MEEEDRRAKYRRGRVGKQNIRRMFGPEKQRKRTRKSGKVFQNFGGRLEDENL